MIVFTILHFPVILDGQFTSFVILSYRIAIFVLSKQAYDVKCICVMTVLQL